MCICVFLCLRVFSVMICQYQPLNSLARWVQQWYPPHCCLFHLLVIHNHFLDVEIIALACSHLQENDRKQTSNYDEKNLQLKLQKDTIYQTCKSKTEGGPRWVIIWASLWLEEDESLSWMGGKCLGGKVKEERGRLVICWFMAPLSGGCLRQTVIKMKLSPWWKRRGICHALYIFWMCSIWKKKEINPRIQAR